MTPEQKNRICLAAKELQAAMNGAGDTVFRIEHMWLVQHTVGKEQPRYVNEIAVVATSEMKVFP